MIICLVLKPQASKTATFLQAGTGLKDIDFVLFVIFSLEASIVGTASEASHLLMFKANYILLTQKNSLQLS